jgi:hypothetical protein
LGLVILVLGIIYMLLTRFALKSDKQDKPRDGWKRRTFRDLIKEYRLTRAGPSSGDPPRLAADWSAPGRSETPRTLWGQRHRGGTLASFSPGYRQR